MIGPTTMRSLRRLVSDERYAAGGLLPGETQVRVEPAGTCLLEGYPLVRVDGGRPEHVIQPGGAAWWAVLKAHEAGTDTGRSAR